VGTVHPEVYSRTNARQSGQTPVRSTSVASRYFAHLISPIWGSNRVAVLVLPGKQMPILAAPDFKLPTSHLSR
jgi:hypothetical protein